jgi:hypothetical protein
VAATRAEAPAADVELAAGVTTGRKEPAQRAKVEDIALGVPGRVDVSVDLSDQIGVSPNDVKEAVRASKVMNAVEIPADLKNALDSAEAKSAPTAQKKPPPTPAKGTPAVDTKAADAAKAEAAKAEAAAKAAEAAKAEAARKAAEATKAAEAAKAEAAKAAKSLPRSRSNPKRRQRLLRRLPRRVSAVAS